MNNIATILGVGDRDYSMYHTSPEFRTYECEWLWYMFGVTEHPEFCDYELVLEDMKVA